MPSLLALPDRACGLTQTAHLLHYLAIESAGQCGPCTFGLSSLAEDLTTIACSTRDAQAAHARLIRRLDIVTGRGACNHPDGAARLAHSALRVFARDLDRHLTGRPCPAAAGAPVLPLPRPGVPTLPPQRAAR